MYIRIYIPGTEGILAALSHDQPGVHPLTVCVLWSLDLIGTLSLSAMSSSPEALDNQANTIDDEANTIPLSNERGEVRAGPDYHDFWPVAVRIVARWLSHASSSSTSHEDAREGVHARGRHGPDTVPVRDVHLFGSMAAWNMMLASPHLCRQHLQECEQCVARQLLLASGNSAQGVNKLALVVISQVRDSASGSLARHEAAGCLDMLSRCCFNLPLFEKADVCLALIKALSDERADTRDLALAAIVSMGNGLAYRVAGLLESTISVLHSAVLADGSSPPDYQRTQYEACRVVMTLGQYPHARTVLVKLGALGPLVQCLQRAPQQETRNLAMLALSNIARGGPGLASSVALAGAMEPLGEMLWSSACLESSRTLTILSACGQVAAARSWASAADGLVEMLQWRAPEDVAARQSALEAICAMSRWGPLPPSTDRRLTNGGEAKAGRGKPPEPSLSEVMVEARFPAGALRDMIVHMFRDPMAPPELAETSCQTLVNFWRHPEVLSVLISASSSAPRAYAALQANLKSHKSRGRGLGVGEVQEGERGLLPDRVLLAIDALLNLLALVREARIPLAEAFAVDKFKIEEQLKRRSNELTRCIRTGLLLRIWRRRQSLALRQREQKHVAQHLVQSGREG